MEQGLVCRKNRHILIAVDASENAQRAVDYVGFVLGGLSGFSVSMLTVVQVPPRDFFVSDSERSEWIVKNRTDAEAVLAQRRGMLLDAGFDENAVTAATALDEYPSIAEVVVRKAEEEQAGTIVIGRRGISRKEEFLFGSTSDSILHRKKGCGALWIID